MFLNKTIRLFLDSIGRREEYEYYLERFSAGRPRAFAVLVPERDGFEDTAGVFAFDMSFLLRLGLDPVVLLCGAEAETMCALLLAEDHPFEVYRADLKALEGKPALLMERLEVARQAGKALVLTVPAASTEETLRSLTPGLTRRIHFIRMRGPLHDAEGRPLHFYQTQHPSPLAEEDRPLVELAGRLLDIVDGLHISVASPLQLLEELFTVKGAGCLIRRGARIVHYGHVSELAEERLAGLLEAGFGKRLRNRDFLAAASDFYVEELYRGAAVLEPCDGMMYLSKFTVQAEARGEGLAQEIWRALVNDHRALFWRSSLHNPINHWYDRQADGSHREGNWKFYWKGIATARIPGVIRNAAGRPEDFEREETPGAGTANGY
jgi:hypothetical protein